MMPMSCAGLTTRAETRQFGSSIKTTCERVRPTDETRPTRPSEVKTGRLVGHTVAFAQINLNGAPPVGRVAQDDVGKFQFPRLLLLPADERAELVVFPRNGVGLLLADFKLLVFAPEIFDFLEQFTAGQNGVGGAARQLPDGIDGPKQRQKQSADGELEV